MEYLKENGFFYHHIMREFECIDSNGIARIVSGYAKIPETTRAINELVNQYRTSSIDSYSESNL